MHILVTGGAGYIGSHTCLELLEAGHQIIVMDNLSNSKLESLKRVQELTGKGLILYKTDLNDATGLRSIFNNHEIEAVIHFAGLKAVGESVEQPLKYYDNNVSGTVNLCRAMQTSGVKNIIFSSSATVYGDPHTVPVLEDFPLSATNPYGRSKLIIEEILGDLNTADSSWNIVLLRYFNPVGAHKSGRIGENPNGIPNNLMPYIAQVACGRLQQLAVFGNDYPTADGTGVRDYIHVVDLALGHVRALQKFTDEPDVRVYNLGTGRGYSVLEMIAAFERASGREIPYKIVKRRAGDIAECYADPTKARVELGWQTEKDIQAMCDDVWRWQSNNPQGFE